MKERILLQENENVANSVIAAHERKSNNGTQILTMLDQLGLKLSSFESWPREVEQNFRKEYPKASLDFCLDAAGIKEPYRIAESFYLANKNDLSFEQLTKEQIEAIREQYRTYADSDIQIELHNLAHKVAKDLNRLQELGISVNHYQTNAFCSVLISENGKVQTYTKGLNAKILSLK
ncbi:hypothetical protein [Flavobacterium xanthum]|uniref:Uncharacterized protein n=1 Tax=Flavobacterium xanthum TaxID=69322 RepID=A0A1M7I4F5_9FLAO|nr:hypothetical protein [Flavobacterium xanthum]SHM35672.1 hypothetical protein SAMN05443669_103220 [Flavobacterium xanthum]